MTKEIADIIAQFDKLRFTLINDEKELRAEVEEYDYLLYSNVDILKNRLLENHISGNDILLTRVKQHFNRYIENELKIQIDFVLIYENIETTVKSEVCNRLIEMQIAYSREIVEYIDRLTTNTPDSPKDKLAHKQQILLLKQLGFFDIPLIKNLTTVKKGKLISHLLNKNEKESLEIVRGLMGKPDKKYDTKTINNIEVINNLLNELGLNECLVK